MSDAAKSDRIVTINLDNLHQIKRLADAFCLARWSHISDNNECDPLTFESMRRALEEYAKPRPVTLDPSDRRQIEQFRDLFLEIFQDQNGFSLGSYRAANANALQEALHRWSLRSEGQG